MKNVYIVDGNNQYSALFTFLGFSITHKLEKADLVCFTGGEDVTPSVYGDKRHPLTGSNVIRDSYELQVFAKAKELKTPCVGICRGAQFLNVMSGGRMYQHVTKHCNSHYLTDEETGEKIYVSSTHHQMMMPGEGATLVASGNEKGDREWYDGQVAKRDISDKDIEVLFYPETQSLCFQPHPEFDSVEYVGMRKYFKELLSRFLSL